MQNGVTAVDIAREGGKSSIAEVMNAAAEQQLTTCAHSFPITSSSTTKITVGETSAENITARDTTAGETTASKTTTRKTTIGETTTGETTAGETTGTSTTPINASQTSNQPSSSGIRFVTV